MNTLFHLCKLHESLLKMSSKKVVQPYKFVFLIALLSLLSLSIGSANRSEAIVLAALAEPTQEIKATASADFSPGFYFTELLLTEKPVLLTDISTKRLIYDFDVLNIHERIMDSGQLSIERMLSFLWLHSQRLDLQYARQLTELYLKEAAAEGVNHDIAFGQMCLETGFLKYTGDVSQSQNNYCGLGATGNAEPGLSFASPQEGVRAHIQHLKAYGSTDSLHNELVDSRFRFVKRGSAQSIKELTGVWATDPVYDYKINSILKRLYDGSYARPLNNPKVSQR